MVTLAGLALSLALIFHFILKSPIQSGSALLIENAIILPEQKQTNLPAGQADFGLPASPIGRPVRLEIPRINVDTAIEYVGLTSDGAMDIPKNQNDVAWFNLGPRPGEKGSSVIAVHLDRGNGMPAVFDNLYKLRQGDKLYVEDDKGVIISFVVRASRRYDPKADASDVFGSNDGKPHLNLITCEGVWNKVSKSYSERLVVFTDKETE